MKCSRFSQCSVWQRKKLRATPTPPRSCKFSAQKFAISLQIFCVCDAQHTTNPAGVVAKHRNVGTARGCVGGASCHESLRVWRRARAKFASSKLEFVAEFFAISARGARKTRLHFPSACGVKLLTSAQLSLESMQHLATQNFAFSTEITQIFRARKAKNSRNWCKIFARFSSVRCTKLLMSANSSLEAAQRSRLSQRSVWQRKKNRVQRRLRRDRANFPRKSSRTRCKFSAFAMRNTPPIQPASLQKI